jgi:acylphosphatase
LAAEITAKRFYVAGRVQGVGFRHFVRNHAFDLGIRGYALNLDDGRVEVYAIGSARQLNDLEGLLRKGPKWADVRTVEVQEAGLLQYDSFHIKF